jgi:outer membrane protein TolC
LTFEIVPPTERPPVPLTPEQAVAQAEGRTGFSATLSAEYGLNPQAGSFGGAYRDPLNQQQFGINFSVPLWQNGRGEAEVDAAEANRRQVERRNKLEREQLEKEVYFEVVQLEQARKQVRIAAKADTVAQRRFEGARQRYSVGNITTSDLFNAQQEKDAARRSYIQALQQFWASYYRLQRLTLYDFAADRPLDATRRGSDE